MRVIHDGPHSLVSEQVLTSIVVKEPVAFLEFNVLAREWVWLSRLWRRRNENPSTDTYRFPIPHKLDPDSFMMSDCGVPLTPENLPITWKRQAEYILGELKTFDCSHNDIRPANLLVKSGLLHLVDFQWSTEIGAPIPPEWPKALGGKYKKGEHDFDDSYSLWKSLEEIADA